ncbi:hypothetical protein DV453_001365 [Geotrichum candidum]|nr:hypothetical protein DV453_001365 [Geotrichum candidum]
MSATQITLDTVYQALEAASSQNDADQRKVGEEQLKAWEIIPGFHSFLQNVYLNTSFPLPVRWIAAIYLKNGLMRYWRKTASNGINDDEKAQIRLHLFELAKEPNKSLNTQNALIVAKIAKFDFPREWPSLFADVCNLVASAQATGNIIELNNLLSTLNQIVKTLSVSRFGTGRTGFQAAASDLVKVTGQIYLQSTQQWMQSIDLASMEVGYMALKVTGKVLAEGYANCSRSEEARVFFKHSVEHFQGFVRIYDKQPIELIAKHIRTLGKIYTHIFERQPVSFLMMPDALQLIQSYLSIVQSKAGILQQVGSADEDEDIVEFWEKIVVQGLTLLRKVITLFHKNGVSTIRYRTQDDKEEAKQAFEFLEKSLFTPEIINSIVDLLLTSYFKLTPRDLENWRSEPEEWIIEQMNDSWEYQARPCAEQVFTDLLANFKDIVGPSLLTFMEKAGQSDDLLVRDVAYNAFAIASASPFENINFDEMLVHGFVPQGFQTGSNVHSVIRRRIAIIISEWVSVQCSDESRIEIYKLLDHFLDPTDPLNDKVVRLYACQALRYTIDEWNTKIPDFLPYLPRILERMFELLAKDLTLIESKKFVLQVLSVIVDRVERSIAPYTDLIMQVLPPLWDESEDNYQMKCIILQTLANLIQSTGENSLKCYSLAIPMLKVSVDPGSELFSYLLEDALPLWVVLAENAPAINEHLLQLLPALIALIKNNTESLTDELKILESYVLLDSEYVLQHYGQAMFELFAQYLPNMSTESASLLNATLDLVFQKNGTEIMGYGERLLVGSGLFATLLAVLLDENSTSPITCVEILGSFSRLAHANPSAFVQCVATAGIPTAYKEQHPDLPAVAENDAVGVVLDFWLGKFDNMGHPRQRKLNALGLTSLVRTGHASVMRRLQDIMVIWSQVLDEVHESGEGDAEVYYTNDETSYLRSVRGARTEDEAATIAAEQELVSPETARKSALFQTDPVHTVRLKEYINAALSEVGALSADHAKFLSTALDPALIDTLSGVLK